MKIILLTMYTAIFFLGLAAGGTARAQSDYQGAADMGAQAGDMLFTAEDMDDLLAPIALYPDPLLAQILPAATFIDQIDEAARYVRQYGRSALIDDQPWDVSVKAVAHYPDILFMMDQKYDWTASLGQAFINQQQDVMDAIQRLRADAEAEGNLSSTSQQQVINEDGYISIVPAEPDTIFVPQYDPQVVYFERSPSFGFITFGIGLTIGAWLDRDCDWHGRRVFYHGWQGGGWISRARPHIHDRRNIYINKNNTVISLSRRVVQHNTVNFREDLRRNARGQRGQAPLQATRPRDNQQGGRIGNRGAAAERPVTTVTRPAERPVTTVTRPAERPVTTITRPAERPVTTITRPVVRPDNSALYRGRETQGPQPAARSGYGGYGSEREATTYRERGQSSRANMGQFNRQQQVPVQSQRPAAAQRPAISPSRQPVTRPATHPAPRQAQPVNRGGGEERKHR
jgi:hypothetical protein